MKKLLLLLPLLLMGCLHKTWIDTPVSSSVPVPVVMARGTDGYIDWVCELKEFNQSLAWVQCDFHNRSAVWLLSSACINVRFYNEPNMALVAESREVCSGPLFYNQNKTNYAAFTKEKRDALRKCGENLQSCVMLVGNSPE